MKTSHGKKYLKVSAHTWQKDTHSLFDNDTGNISKSSFKIISSASIYIQNDVCKLYTPKSSKFMLPSYDPLIGFKISQGDFVTYQIGNSPSKRLWKAIRYCNPKGVEIKERDKIKLGRVTMKVRKVVTEALGSEGNNAKCFESLASHLDIEENMEEDSMCRICFGNESSNENPLIAPCECSGSIKYIHTDCIKFWLKSRIQTKTTSSAVSYYWTDLNCELCKVSLPSSVYYLGYKIDLISVEYPKKPYILFEEFSPDNNSSTGMHIVTINEGKTISIGRSQEAEFRIPDISVSRTHASLSFAGDKFILCDKKSKFGTLVKMKKVVSLGLGKKISIQVGRTIFHIQVEKKMIFRKCCCNPFKKVLPEWSYITQEGIDQSAIEVDNTVIRQSRSFAYVEE